MVESPVSCRSVLPVAAGFEAGLALVAIVLGAILGVDPLATLVWDRWSVCWGLLAAAPLFLVLWMIVRFPVGPFRKLLELVDQFLDEALRGATLWYFALISLMAGIGEETLFRGLAQPLLGDLIGSRVAGVALASILFGLAHSVTPTYAVLATIVGAYLGLLWILTENLLAPIVAHAAYDFFALWYLKVTAPRRRAMRSSADLAGGNDASDQV